MLSIMMFSDSIIIIMKTIDDYLYFILLMLLYLYLYKYKFKFIMCFNYELIFVFTM